jgi:hypothetical protein
MKIHLRNLAAIDVSQVDDHSAATLRFVTASKDEVVVVVPHELLQSLRDNLLALVSEAEGPVSIGEEQTVENKIRNIFSKGVTRVA